MTSKAVQEWNPAETLTADMAVDLADEYQNDYLTVRTWAEAHHMDEAHGEEVLRACQRIRAALQVARLSAGLATNPHL